MPRSYILADWNSWSPASLSTLPTTQGPQATSAGRGAGGQVPSRAGWGRDTCGVWQGCGRPNERTRVQTAGVAPTKHSVLPDFKAFQEYFQFQQYFSPFLSLQCVLQNIQTVGFGKIEPKQNSVMCQLTSLLFCLVSQELH